MEAENNSGPAILPEAPLPDHDVDNEPADVPPPSTAEDAEADAPVARPSQQSSILDMVAALFFRSESVPNMTTGASPEGGAEESGASPQLPLTGAEAATKDTPEGTGGDGEAESGEAIHGSHVEEAQAPEQQISEPQDTEQLQPAVPSGGILSAVTSLFSSRQSADGADLRQQEREESRASVASPGLEAEEAHRSDVSVAPGEPGGVSAAGDASVVADINGTLASDTQIDSTAEPSAIDVAASAESTSILAAIASMFRRRSTIYDSDNTPPVPDDGTPINPEVAELSQAFDEATSDQQSPEAFVTASSSSQLQSDQLTNAVLLSTGMSQSVEPESSSTQHQQARATVDAAGAEMKSGVSALNGENDLDEEELLQIALQISIEEGSGPKPQMDPLSPGKLDKSRSSRRSSFKTTFTSKDAHEGWAIDDAPRPIPTSADASSSTELAGSASASREVSENLTRSQKYEKAMKKLEDDPELVDEIRFARRYRRASLVPEQDLDLYPAAEPDCGKVGKKPHLSRAHAIETTEQFRMGYYEEGQRKPFPLSCSFGWHRWPFSTYEQTDNGALVDYGLGVSLYFKLVKALIMLFFFMNLCTVPPMLMYILGDSIEPVQRQYYKDTNSQNILGATTMASLGQPFPICQRVGENETFQFSCPGEAKIQSIVAYYGQPQGSCTCPGVQSPDSSGNCIGTISGVVRNSLSNQLNYLGQHCVADSAGYVAPCFLGLTRFGVNCCSSTLNNYGSANLSALALSANLRCNSLTAQFIAESLCLYQNSCSFVVEVR